MKFLFYKYAGKLLFILVILFPLRLLSQPDTAITKRICYTSYMTRLNAAHFNPGSYLPLASQSADNGIEYLVIPVVFHIIHDTGAENLPDDVIISQLNVMNEDFGNYGLLDNDFRAVDTRIRFCLAKKDPAGNPTTGIVRVQSPYTDMQSDNEMQVKNLSRWDPHHYFNIWVVRSIDGSSGIQGYSYLPGETGGPNFSGDGLVLVYRFVGRFNPVSPSLYNRGRTAVHESGHYLNLLHTWGHDGQGQGGCDDDDGIDDTPVCSLEYYSAPPVCPHPFQCGYTRMIENYLDYSYDLCMKVFTQGQKNSMRAALYRYRAALMSYSNLTDCGCNNFYDSLNATANVVFYPNPSPGGEMHFRIFNQYASDINFSMYDLSGRKLKEFGLSGIKAGNYDINFEGVRPGVYVLRGQFLNQAFRQKVVIAN